MGKELEFCVQPRLKVAYLRSWPRQRQNKCQTEQNNFQCKKTVKLENLSNLFSNRIQLNMRTKQIPQHEHCKNARSEKKKTAVIRKEQDGFYYFETKKNSLKEVDDFNRNA